MSDKARLRSFDPITPAGCRCLILGSMPGTASLDADQYYAHPRNGFWKILQSIFGGNIKSYPQRLQILENSKIALWDTLKYCHRPGSLDANIDKASVECNDFYTLLRQYPTIELIGFNGKAAEKWFRKLVLPSFATIQPSTPETLTAENFKMVSLPSSSPAMAMLSLDEKTMRWRDALTQIIPSK